MGASKRRRIEPTHEWQLLLPLFEWPEQERYEQIRPLVLFDASIAERAAEVGTPTSTLYRRLDRFAEEGMESLFDAPAAKRRRLPPSVRRFIVDLKAEYPAFNLNEIANVVGAAFGSKPDVRSVGRVLSEEPVPLKIVRNYPPYHETEDPREARTAIVALRLDGWSVKAIAGYLGVHHSTVYRALDRWKEGGFEALADGPPGRPPGVRKTDFAAIEAIRKLALNPGLGAFRVHAALEQMGFDLSRATCGRILARIREVYGYEKPESGDGSKRAMPFAATERHEVWSADVRHLDMVDEELVGSTAYAVTIMDNYSRAILASAVTRRQDLSALLLVFYRAAKRYGAPKTLLTDSGSIFLANRARAVYAKLGVNKEDIEKGRPWQNFSETTFGIQGRMADWHFGKAESWAELVAAHDRFVSDYNAQSHFAHQRRDDSRRSPGEVLSWVSGMRFHPAGPRARLLLRAPHAGSRRLGLHHTDAVASLRRGGARRRGSGAVACGEHPHRRARGRAALGLRGRLRRAGRGGSGRLLEVSKPTLFKTPFAPDQMRLFGLAETLGEGGWLKALRLEDYVARRPRRPPALQQALFPYHEAWG